MPKPLRGESQECVFGGSRENLNSSCPLWFGGLNSDCKAIKGSKANRLLPCSKPEALRGDRKKADLSTENLNLKCVPSALIQVYTVCDLGSKVLL